MRYFKLIAVATILLLYSQNCFAENWVMEHNTGIDVIFLDRDSVNFHNNSLYYNIHILTYSTGNKGIYSIIQSKGDSAGVVQSCDNKTCLNSQTPKTATNFKPITEKSLLYWANIKAQEIYNSNQTYSDKPGIEALKKADFKPYMNNLQRQIKKNWKPPKGTETKRAVVLFTIAKDGRLLSVKILKTSGNQEFDKAALNAVLLTAPFKPLPAEYEESSLDIQFTFDYNIFGQQK